MDEETDKVEGDALQMLKVFVKVEVQQTSSWWKCFIDQGAN